MRGYVPDDRGQRAHAQRVVVRNGNMVGLWLVAGKPDMTAGLARGAVADTFEPFDSLSARNVSRQTHSAITSSCVKWNRIRRGAFPSSK